MRGAEGRGREGELRESVCVIVLSCLPRANRGSYISPFANYTTHSVPPNPFV